MVAAKTNSSLKRKLGKAEKLQKPIADFLQFPHDNKLWTKDINGKSTDDSIR